jgi:glycerophosphoryl diester phosphodiesterase
LLLSACTMAGRAPVADTNRRLPSRARLERLAVMPALTFAAGPPSGHFIDRGGPFPSQPVQGFSSLQSDGDGFIAISDNGYGSPETSSDFELRAYRLFPDFERGVLTATALFTLSDPDKRIQWPIRNHFTAERILTGADLDPESLVRAPDGTYWIGDEHGPYLVHVDAQGRVLEPPVLLELDGDLLRGPDAPTLPAPLMLRTMEALRGHALLHDAGPPFLSPDHRLLVDAAHVRALHQARFRVVPWTVNEPERLATLLGWGVDGVITDRPDLGGAFRDAGLEVQGHRGARGLAPENTPAAFQAGLSAGASVLELDLSATADGDAIVWHDPALRPPKCPRARTDAGFIAAIPLARLVTADCDGRLPAYPLQRVDGGSHRVMSLDQALRLPAPLNLETKVHDTGLDVDDAESLARLVARRVQAADAGARVTLQSFDWRALTVTHREAPWLQTVALLGDRSLDMPEATRAGLPWTVIGGAPRLGRSAGFENLALTADGGALIAMLEKPLPGKTDCLAFRFDLTTKQWTSVAFRYPLDPRATAVGDLTFIDERSGYALERDDTERRTDGFKRLVRFTLPATEGGAVTKRTAADLLDLELPDGGTFRFPFWTIEGVAVLRDGRVVIVNDNNLPFGRGRSEDAPDPTELIVVAPLE